MTFWVYILRCADASYYTGHTDNLEKRVGEHATGAIAGCYTFKRRPVQLVFSQDYATREEALTAEQQIKGWSRKKKEAMIQGDWVEVSRLAQSSNRNRPEPTQSVRPELFQSVRPEPFDFAQDRLVEKQQPNTPTTVRPELVEGCQPSSAHGSTSSPRTEDEAQP